MLTDFLIDFSCNSFKLFPYFSLHLMNFYYFYTLHPGVLSTGLMNQYFFLCVFYLIFCFPLTFSSNLNLFPQLTCQFIRCLTTWNFNISIPWSSFIEDTYWLTKTAITKCHTLSSFTRENVFTVWCWQCKFKVLKDWLHLKPLLVYLWLSSSWAFLWSSLWISAY